MSLAFTRLSPTPIVQTLHHSPSAAEVALWSRYPEAPFVAISNEQARLLQRPQRRRHGAARHRHRQLRVPRDSPTTTCCSSAASPKARACCRRSRSPGASGMRLILAAAEDDYYRETVAPHVDGTQIVYFGEADFDGEGEAVRRRARAALSDSGARAVRPGAGRGDGLRHAGRRARSRRRARGRRRRRDRASSSTTSSRWPTGCRACFDLDRRRVRERAVARFGVERMVDEYVAVYQRIVEAASWPTLAR